MAPWNRCCILLEGQEFRPSVALGPAQARGKNGMSAIRRKFQNFTCGRGRDLGYKKIARAVKSQAARLVQSGGECAPSAVGSKHKNCVAAPRVSSDLGRDEEIAEPIKGQTGRALIRIERRGPDENGACPARCEHIDRLATEVGCVEISPAIKGEAIALWGGRQTCSGSHRV